MLFIFKGILDFAANNSWKVLQKIWWTLWDVQEESWYKHLQRSFLLTMYTSDTYLYFKISIKGPYFNYVSTFLSIFDQLSTLVSIFTTVPDNSYSTVVSILQTK